MSADASNGYEAIADEYMAVRSTSGRTLIEAWAATLPPSGSIIDIGAGHGEPLTSVFIEKGFSVFAIDASPAMVAAFVRRFPGVEVACEPVEASRFFDRRFDAALAVGLIFLLGEETQRALIRKIAAALKPDGKLLFSAPRQTCTWTDILTGQPSLSLGIEEYGRILASSGLQLVEHYVDEGGSDYHEAQKC